MKYKPLNFTIGCMLFLLAVNILTQPLVAQNLEKNNTDNAAIILGSIRSSKTNELLSGVVLKVIEARRGAISGNKGTFRVENLPAGRYSVQSTLLGYKTSRTTVTLTSGEIKELNITLEDDPIRSEEVVVSGQGLGVERRRISTNTAVVSAEQLDNAPIPRFEQVLQAAIPNAQFSVRSGLVGATSTIRTRGINSVSVGSTPIVYVDGVRLDNLNSRATLTTNVSSFGTYPTEQSTQTSALADIPMDNIERIEFVGGGAATTLYGSDAANGVIQIFTKNGLGRSSTLSFEARVGVDAASTQFLRFRRTAELLYRPGVTQQYTLSASGGGADWGYSLSGTARHGDGFRVNNSQSDEYSVRLGVNAQLAPVVRYISSFGFSSNNYKRAKDGNAGNYTPLWFAEDGLAVAYGFKSDIDALPEADFAKMKDFVRHAEDLTNNRISTLRFQTSQALEFTPLPNLTVKVLGGVDFRRSNERVVITNEYLIHTTVVPAGTSNRGTIDDVTRNFTGLTFEATAQHRAEFGAELGELSLISNVGGQLFRTSDEQTRLYGENVRDGATTISGAGVQTGDQYRSQLVNYGIYALENLGIQNKYFLEVGVRADGNSAFGRDVGIQVYPKVGLSYVLSEESFFQPLKTVISSARFRANYGIAGNFPPPFRRDRTIAFASYNGQPAATFGQAENTTLRPEKTTTIEVGADISLFDNALTLGATYYNARTRDALFNVPNALSVAEPTILKNVGEILNRGVELKGSAQLLNTSDFALTLNASLNTTVNEVLNSGGTSPFAIGGYSAATVQNIVAEGAPVGFLRGAKAVINADGTYSVENYQANLGSTIPSGFGSISLSATFLKRLNLFISSDYQYGAVAHSFDRQFQFLFGIGDGRVPASAIQGKVLNQVWTDFTAYFVEKTDFWRVRLISLTYDLPPFMTEGIAKQVTVGFSVSNPFGWTAATFDPEAANAATSTQNGATVTGASYGIDSMPRTWLGTIRITF